VASSTNPATSTANRAPNTIPSLCPNTARGIPAAARSVRRRGRVSGLRGDPSATESTRSAESSPGGSSRGSAASPLLARPQITWAASASSRRVTYRVRPASRTWLGAGSPNAAATNDGAAMAELDSTAQSGKKLRIRSPRPVLKIRITSRRSGLSSWARSAA
jgi:hypothetical protein